MGRRSAKYNPRAEAAEILRRSLEHINSVDYKVSLRWVFYRLFQDGLFKGKGGYGQLKDWAGRARHALWEGWRPDTLADETRSAIIRGDGFNTARDYLEAPNNLPNINYFADQDYIEIWFEARAMREQFEKYSQNITLVPLGGDPSIPLKYSIAKRLSGIKNDAMVLYFGDCDDKGKSIAQVALEDVRKWCLRDFDLHYMGLTLEQARKYGVPESPFSPGFQWEALLDADAAEIIESAIAEHVDADVVKRVDLLRADLKDWLDDKGSELADEWEKENPAR